MGPWKKPPFCGAVDLSVPGTPEQWQVWLGTDGQCLQVWLGNFTSAVLCLGLGLGRLAQAVGRAGQASQLSLSQKSTLLLWGVGAEAKENTPQGRLFLTWQLKMASMLWPVTNLLAQLWHFFHVCSPCGSGVIWFLLLLWPLFFCRSSGSLIPLAASLSGEGKGLNQHPCISHSCAEVGTHPLALH